MKQKFHLRQTQILCAFLILIAISFFWQSCKKQVLPIPQDPSVENTIDNTKQTRGYYKMLNLGTFIYYNQLTTGPSNTYRFNGCLAASCLMGAHLYASPIQVNTNTFSAYCAGMGVNGNGAYINHPTQPSAYSYLKNNVFNTQPLNVAQQLTTAGRSATISGIKSYLTMNRSVVALIKYNTGTKLPTTGTGVPHFVLIVGLSESSPGIGTISYYDPYGNTGLKNHSWSAFLNAMAAGAAKYNYMRIGS